MKCFVKCLVYLQILLIVLYTSLKAYPGPYLLELKITSIPNDITQVHYNSSMHCLYLVSIKNNSFILLFMFKFSLSGTACSD